MKSMRGSRMRLALALCTVATAGFTIAIPAEAQEKFPSRPIEMIVPTPPGGGVDLVARMLAEAAEPLLGVRVLIANVSGATGGVGVGRMIRAKPDGYTLAFVWNAPITIVPHTLEVNYGPQQLTPITQTTGGTPLIFCVKPDFPAGSGKELVEVLKRNPEKYTYGNDGVGGMVQLAGERVFQPLGIKLRPIPYGGAADTLRAFLGGQIDIYGGSVPAIGNHVKEGRAKCLLVTTKDRNPSMAEAAGTGELGMPDKETELWRGVVGPKDMPADRLKVLEDTFRAAAQAPRLRDYAAKAGEQIVASTAVQFQRLITAEYRDFGQIVEALGLGKK